MAADFLAHLDAVMPPKWRSCKQKHTCIKGGGSPLQVSRFAIFDDPFSKDHP